MQEEACSTILMQEESRWLLEELQCVEQKIEATQQDIMEAMTDQKSYNFIRPIEKERNRLIEKEKDLRSTLQARLASSAGEGLCGCPMLTGALRFLNHKHLE